MSAKYRTIDEGKAAVSAFLGAKGTPQTCRQMAKHFRVEDAQVFAGNTRLSHLLSGMAERKEIHAVYRPDAPTKKLYSMAAPDGQQHLPFTTQPGARRPAMRVVEGTPNLAPEPEVRCTRCERACESQPMCRQCQAELERLSTAEKTAGQVATYVDGQPAPLPIPPVAPPASDLYQKVERAVSLQDRLKAAQADRYSAGMRVSAAKAELHEASLQLEKAHLDECLVRGELGALFGVAQ